MSGAGDDPGLRYCEKCGAMVIGTWPTNDLRRAFVDGAKWWQFHANGATAFASEQDEMEAEAEKRHPVRAASPSGESK